MTDVTATSAFNNVSKSEKVENRLFVMGSLYEGQVHYNRLGEFVVDKKSAWVQGTAFQLECGYPVLICGDQSATDRIEGQLLTLDVNTTFWNILDELHGFSPVLPEKSLFLRLSIEVNGEEGPIQTMTYAMNPLKLPKTAQKIEGGAWLEPLLAKEPLTQTLTSNQICYIQKLGKSSGRDIVPINLDLYRELMSKGLIVDKGRRLALTSLGQEVFRYLE